MSVNPIQLLDPLSLAIVLGGSLAATLLRCGWRDARTALRVLVQLPARPFDSQRVRAELAAQVREIGKDGILRAEPHHFGDGEFDELSDALIRQRSIRALHDEHARHRRQRQEVAETAAHVCSEAAELSPVLGLAGTLVALGGISAVGEVNYAHSIATAVITTLYGLVFANFLFGPLAGAIARRARAEEQQREELLEWLAQAIERTIPTREGGRLAKAAA
jgi:chemotaxis protein MotA